MAAIGTENRTSLRRMRFGRELTRLAVAALFAAGGALGAQADALEDIQASGTLRAGIFADFPPFSSASSDLSIQGYDVDVATQMADRLGVELELVSVTGQNRIPFLTDGRVDILMSVGYSDERAEVIDYAAPYAPYYIAVIGPAASEVAGPEDLAGRTIAVNRGTLEDTSLTEAAPQDATIRRFDNYSSVIQAFISGQTELMVVGNDVGAQVLSQQVDLAPEQKFQLLTSPSWIALNKGEPALQQELSAAVESLLESGALDAASQEWLGTPLDPANLQAE